MTTPSGTPMSEPGWGEAVRLGVTYRLAHAPNALISIRALFVSLVSAMVFVAVAGIVVVATSDLPGTVDAAVAAIAVAVVGLGASVAAGLVRPPLSCDSEGALIGGYRVRVLIGTALSEVALLLGFVGAVLSANVLPLAAGGLVTLWSLARVAPTTAHVERGQRELLEGGCALSLQGVLLHPFSR
ncbi:MAG: hypothetical protein ACXIVQ_17740 [Acidimicrobiales bacterium]